MCERVCESVQVYRYVYHCGTYVTLCTCQTWGSFRCGLVLLLLPDHIHHLIFCQQEIENGKDLEVIIASGYTIIIYCG